MLATFIENFLCSGSDFFLFGTQRVNPQYRLYWVRMTPRRRAKPTARVIDHWRIGGEPGSILYCHWIIDPGGGHRLSGCTFIRGSSTATGLSPQIRRTVPGGDSGRREISRNSNPSCRVSLWLGALRDGSWGDQANTRSWSLCRFDAGPPSCLVLSLCISF